jgi:serine protease Do
MRKKNYRYTIIVAVLVILLLGAVVLGAVADRLFALSPLNALVPRIQQPVVTENIISGENNVVEVVKRVGPSVVTVSGEAPRQNILQFSPFGGFSQGTIGGQAQDIGSGFVVESNGLIVTNKHVVSDPSMTYSVTTSDGKKYNVTQISKDPNNDIAFLKINATGLKPVVLGDSSNLQVGEPVIAIGTALGQFRNTVTTGVVSGLGRGIQAGNIYQGYVEQLDNVIQTDAAINPGNSGGPLLNSAGQVIGINVAVAEGAQNIAFAIPINTVKSSLSQYEQTGSFPAKAYLGIEYQMISQQTAILNDVPQGAYVVQVISGSPADKAGLQTGDIITKLDGTALTSTGSSPASLISAKKPGDSVTLTVWRDGQTLTITSTLSAAPQ